MNTNELLDDYAIELAKRVLEQQMPEAVYDDIAVVPTDCGIHREVYFINHPQYYCVRVAMEEVMRYGNSYDSGPANLAA